MNARSMQLSKMAAAGPSIRGSMLGPSIQPLYTEAQQGLDFEKDVMGVSIFLSGIDKWGDPRKKVGK